MISLDIQNDIVNFIVMEMDHKLFSILIDEFKDVSSKEQMLVVFEYVDKGHVIKWLGGIIHVANKNALKLTVKEYVDVFFSTMG